MNWRKAICWLMGHKWQVFEGKRHCTACGYDPKDDDVIFCPECGSERLTLCIMVSDGYQHVECRGCGHKFQDTSGSIVKAGYGNSLYELEKPMVNQDGIPIEQEKEECSHEWHADQDNDCNFCVKCGARQEIYTE